MRTTETLPFSRSREALFVLLGAGLMALMAQIFIPLKPVPITLQTVGMLIIGLTYSSRQAFLSLLAYLGLGAVGVPVFQSFSAGPAVLMGPCAGYLFGFLVVVTGMAWLRETLNLKGTFPLFGLAVLGQVVLYIFGVSWLAVTMPLESAISVGVVPFIIPGLAKAMITAGLLGYLKKPSEEN